jgi:hypothetical protein
VTRNPAMKAFCDRLVARGMKPKVIQTAMARKLLVIASAIFRTGRRWEPELAIARLVSPRQIAVKRSAFGS